MATKKISELPAADTIDGTELVPVVQAGATKAVTVSALLAPTLGDIEAALIAINGETP